MAHDDDDSFPMLQLPLTMKDMVLQKLSVLDLYNLSHVSEEAKNWVKIYVRNKNYRLKIMPHSRWGYVISLLNASGVGFLIHFQSNRYEFRMGETIYLGVHSEFNFGPFTVPSKNYETGDQLRIDVNVQKEDRHWDEFELLKTFVTHLSDVFTKDVCIHIINHMPLEEQIIMDLVKNLNLRVHCFINTSEEYDFPKIKELTNCRKLSIKAKNIDGRQMRTLLEEWTESGTMDFCEIGNLPKKFSAMMRGFQVVSVDKENQIWNYSVTRADGVIATVKYFKGKMSKPNPRHRHRRGRYYIPGRLIIKTQTEQQYSTCFKVYAY